MQVKLPIEIQALYRKFTDLKELLIHVFTIESKPTIRLDQVNVIVLESSNLVESCSNTKKPSKSIKI